MLLGISPELICTIINKHIYIYICVYIYIYVCVCLLAREAELAMCRCNCLSCNTERRRAWRHSTALRPSVWRCSCDKATSESPKVRDCNTSKPPSQQRAVALLWEHEKAQSDFSVSSAPPVKTAESDRIGSAQAKSPQKHFELALRCRITHTHTVTVFRALHLS